MTQNNNWNEVIQADRYLASKDTLQKRQRIKKMADNANVDRFDAKKIADNILSTNESLLTAVPFVAPTCPYRVCDQDVVLVHAPSGRGKSTIAASIVMSYEGNPKPLLFISNEESSDEVFFRLACYKAGLNPESVRAGEYVPDDWNEVLPKLITDLGQWVKIRAKDKEDIDGAATATAEGLHKILDDSMEGKYCAIVLDYYQGIQETIRNPRAQPHEAQLQFDTKLDLYRTNLKCPFYILAQSKPMTQHSRRFDFQNERQYGNSKVFMKATIVIEMQRVFMNGKTKKNDDVEFRASLSENTPEGASSGFTLFFIHKDRYKGKCTGAGLLFWFVRGKYQYARYLNQEQVEIVP